MKRACGTFLSVLLTFGCTPDPMSPPPGPRDSEANAARTPEPTRQADFILHDGLGYISAPLISTCAGTAYGDWHIAFGATGCLVFTPTGSSYSLGDDIVMGTPGYRKGGTITSVRFWAHDIAGPDGIKHDTDAIPVAIPVTPGSAEFVVHVHADGVPVYRLSGHTGGKRVAMIGTISVWDIVYRTP